MSDVKAFVKPHEITFWWQCPECRQDTLYDYYKVVQKCHHCDAKSVVTAPDFVGAPKSIAPRKESP